MVSSKKLYTFKKYNQHSWAFFFLYAPLKSASFFNFFFNNFICFHTNFTLSLLKSFLCNLNEGLTTLIPLVKFKWFRFVLFSGLGYKRKFFNRYNVMFTYIGNRHWILYKFSPFSFIFPIRRRNFLFFSSSKNDFAQDYSFFSSLQKPYVYKMKGFLDSRVKQRFIFIRRLRLKGIKTKLSKKQQML